MFRKIIFLAIAFVSSILITGCSTTNSIPYKASTNNIITLQNKLKQTNTKVNLGDFVMAKGVDEEPTCRMMGPIKVAPGKTLSTYIKEAFQEELFMAQAYDTSSSTTIEGRIEKIAFSSISPANWEIALHVSSNKSPGYTTTVKYNFDTSYSAASACKNVADAFGPAVQELLGQVVNNSKFDELTK